MEVNSSTEMQPLRLEPKNVLTRTTVPSTSAESQRDSAKRLASNSSESLVSRDATRTFLSKGLRCITILHIANNYHVLAGKTVNTSFKVGLFCADSFVSSRVFVA